jgi:hypothetical protein
LLVSSNQDSTLHEVEAFFKDSGKEMKSAPNRKKETSLDSSTSLAVCHDARRKEKGYKTRPIWNVQSIRASFLFGETEVHFYLLRLFRCLRLLPNALFTKKLLWYRKERDFF